MKKIFPTCDVNNKKWMNLTEATAYLGTGSKDTFREWRETGKLPYYKIGRQIIYKKADLDKFAERHLQKAFA